MSTILSSAKQQEHILGGDECKGGANIKKKNLSCLASTNKWLALVLSAPPLLHREITQLLNQCCVVCGCVNAGVCACICVHLELVG